MEYTKRNLIMHISTFYPLYSDHMCFFKFMQSTALEQKRLDPRSLLPTLPNLWSLLVLIHILPLWGFHGYVKQNNLNSTYYVGQEYQL